EKRKSLIDEGLRDPPVWVGEIPLIGKPASAYWASFAHDNAGLVSELKQYIQPLRTFAIASGTALAHGVLQLTLSILLAFFFYRDGEGISQRLLAGVDRLAGDRGRHLIGVGLSTARGGGSC